MNKVYPYASGSEYTSSYAVTASYARNVNGIAYVTSASIADVVLYPTVGAPAAVNLCLLSYTDYLLVVAGSKEICTFL